MEYKLTTKYQHSKRLKNGTRRSFLLFFINGVKLFEQNGVSKWHIDNIYLLNGRIHQTRWSTDWDSTTNSYIKTTRDVTYPVSKKILKTLGITNELIIKELLT